MRAGAIIFILSILLSISLVSAVSTNLDNQYMKSETIIAKIDGTFLNNIHASDVEFKRGTVRVPLQFDVKRIGESFYIWAIAPQTAGNYTMYIYNLVTPTQQQPFTFSQNFSVSDNSSDYSINPGFIISDGKFSIDVIVNTDSPQTINIDLPTEREINLISGDNNIAFDLSNQYNGLHFMNVGSYSVPLWLNTGITAPINNTNSSTDNSSLPLDGPIVLVVQPNPLYKLAYYGGTPAYGFTIYNRGNVSADNVKILYNSNVLELTPNNEISIDSGNSYSFNVSFIVPLNNSMIQNITIETDSQNITVPMYVDVTNNTSTLLNEYAHATIDNSTNQTSIQSKYYCSELSGTICGSDSSCSGQTVSASDGDCCIGSCSAKSSSGGNSWIGWLIAGIVVLGIAYFWAKYKGVKPSVPKIG